MRYTIVYIYMHQAVPPSDTRERKEARRKKNDFSSMESRATQSLLTSSSLPSLTSHLTLQSFMSTTTRKLTSSHCFQISTCLRTDASQRAPFRVQFVPSSLSSSSLPPSLPTTSEETNGQQPRPALFHSLTSPCYFQTLKVPSLSSSSSNPSTSSPLPRGSLPPGSLPSIQPLQLPPLSSHTPTATEILHLQQPPINNSRSSDAVP